MPFLRLVSITRINNTLCKLYKAYIGTVSIGTYQSYHITTLLMYLFATLEDIVSVYKKDYIIKRVSGKDKGVSVRTREFIEFAKEMNIATTRDLTQAVTEIIFVRNIVAHGFIEADVTLNILLKDIDATDCFRVFKYAFDSVDLSNEAKKCGYELLYDLFRRDGLRVDKNFETLYQYELSLLK